LSKFQIMNLKSWSPFCNFKTWIHAWAHKVPTILSVIPSLLHQPTYLSPSTTFGKQDQTQANFVRTSALTQRMFLTKARFQPTLCPQNFRSPRDHFRKKSVLQKMSRWTHCECTPSMNTLLLPVWSSKS